MPSSTLPGERVRTRVAPGRIPRRRRRHRLAGPAAVVLAAALISMGLLVPRFVPEGRGAAASTAAPTLAPTVAVAAMPSPTVTAPVVPVPGPDTLTSLPGPVPPRGDGAMTFAAGTGPVLGRSGPLRRFRVAVERGSGEDVEEFAALVEQTLGDRRSWTGGGGVRLQRVPKGTDGEFTVYLATRDTARRMCAHGGVNVVVGGVPFTSCRTTGRVILNLDRWRLSAKPYRAAKVTLAVYRIYVLNHEVGHQLGQRHEGCPRRGAPAPVMVQQTLTLRGCTPYPWPRRGGARYAGPRM